jgi:hypothetical protein
MPRSGQDDTTPSSTDGDGVRIIRERSPTRRSPIYVVLVLALIVIAMGYFAWWSPLSQQVPSKPVATVGAPAAEVQAPPVQTTRAEPTMAPRPASPTPATPQSNPADWRTGDANDIATYVSPTDPEPTAAELIQALRDAGERGGIAAFNPPGTSPPLKGLAVPESFELPQGYVRHHQVTDAGEPLEAILMFSPDYVFRVVPAEMAPPGLPIREIEIPPPLH